MNFNNCPLELNARLLTYFIIVLMNESKSCAHFIKIVYEESPQNDLQKSRVQ